MQNACRNVLVVDDDHAHCCILKRQLEGAGYSVDTAADGAQAIQALQQKCHDIVITDWEMPGVNGLDLCRTIRSARLPHYVHVVLLTGKSQNDVVTGLAAGADDYLMKPVVATELVARLTSAERVLRLERQLRFLTRFDPLTSLLNRKTLLDRLECEWSRAIYDQSPLIVALMDVDFFKRVNDTFGHPAGDHVLSSVAGRLLAQSPSTDSLGRYGGEEFCMLLPGVARAEAVDVVESCRREIADHPFEVDGQQLQITCSFGLCDIASGARSANDLVARADAALLHAKRSGRNRVEADWGREPQVAIARHHFGRRLEHATKTRSSR